MSLLAGTLYDPASAATFSTAAAAAMTALDTTNLRLNFTVPANGAVAVKMRTTYHGATTNGSVLLGILEGATVKARHPAWVTRTGANAAAFGPVEAVFVVTGLTPSAALTWDAACGVEHGASALKWGGPDNATTNDARGGFAFEIWEATNLLAAKNYDPGSAVQASTASLLAMTALDTTNLRATFTTPSSGAGSAKVLVRCRAVVVGNASTVAGHLGVLDGATVKARLPCAQLSQIGSAAVTDHQIWDGSGIVAVAANTAYNWDLAYGVENVQTTTNVSYGGPNDTTADNAYGAAVLEVWKAG